MDEYIKFHNQTAGRDKFFRLMQYTSRIIWWDIERRKGNQSQTTVQNIKKLDQLLGLLRQMLRFGRFFETLHSALPLMGMRSRSVSVSDGFVRVVVGMSRVASSCYMLIDHVICIHRLGLISMSNAPKWEKLSTRFWLYSILLSLIRDAHEWIKIYKSKVKWNSNPLGEESKSKKKKGIRGWGLKVGGVLVQNGDLTIDSSKNLLDLALPLNSLNLIRLSAGSVGVIGVISTILSAIPQINPMLKMVPAS
jgi:peroxin-11B